MKKRGFTLVEMLVAVMILTLATTALLSVSAGSAGSVRRAKNKITANWLAQESLDYIRNARDTAMLQNPDPTTGVWWDTWVATAIGTRPLGRTTAARTKCFHADGCYIALDTGSTLAGLPNSIVACTGTCPTIKYNTALQQYSYTATTGQGFVVTVYAQSSQTTLDMLTFTAVVSWQEGANTGSVSQSMILTKWQL